MMKTDRSHKHCLTIFWKFSAYLDEELDAEECREIRKHLRGCRYCWECLETLKRTVALCRNIRSSPLPTGLKMKLKRLIGSP